MDIIELEDCFQDGPHYRDKLIRCDNHLQALEHGLKDVLKSARSVIEQSRHLSHNYETFLEAMAALGRIEANRPTRDSQVQPFFGVCSLETWSPGQHIMFVAEELKRIETARQSLALQMETVLVDPLESLARTDLSSLREVKKRWERTGDRYGDENSRFLARKPAKDPSGDTVLGEAAHEVALARHAYHEASLEYCQRMNEVMAKEELRIVEAISTFVHCRMAFGERAKAVSEDFEANLRCLDRTAESHRRRKSVLGREYAELASQLLERYEPLYNPLSLATNPNTPSREGPFTNEENKLELMGYLYKKSSHSMRPVWSRRFFHLSFPTLQYYTMEGKNNSSTVTIDLRLCTVKIPTDPLPERRNVFEIVCPQKTYTLQTETDREFILWTERLQAAIQRAINEGIGGNSNDTGNGTDNGNGNKGRIHFEDKEKRQRKWIGASSKSEKSSLGRGSLIYETLSSYIPGHAVEAPLDQATRKALQQIPGNNQCADCGQEEPEWASLSLGILICIQCSGIHRSLGVHISKVRSLRLDYWEPEHVQILQGLGNKAVAQIFEGVFYNNSSLPSDSSFYSRPTSESSQEEKEQWIVAKYVLQKFVPLPIPGSEQLITSITKGNLVVVLTWLATHKEEINQILVPTMGFTALHLAVDQRRWEVASLLLLWSANVQARDLKGQTILHLMATTKEDFSLSFLISLLRRVPPNFIDATDSSGETPLNKAIVGGHGDFVTILRMFQHDHRHHLDERRKSREKLASSDGTDEDLDRSPSPTRPEESSCSRTLPLLNSSSSSSSSTQPSPLGWPSSIKAADSSQMGLNNDKKVKKKRTLRRLFRKYPKLYRRFTQHQRHGASGETDDSPSFINQLDKKSNVDGQMGPGEQVGSSKTGFTSALVEGMTHWNPFYHHQQHDNPYNRSQSKYQVTSMGVDEQTDKDSKSSNEDSKGLNPV